MSEAAQNKVFGLRLGIDPKVLVVALLGVAGFLFWHNSRSGEENAGRQAERAPALAGAEETAPARQPLRRTSVANGRSVLRMERIDPTSGDIDPTLRLDLLARLQKVELGEVGRNIFELGPAPQIAAIAKNIRGPVVLPKPLAPAAAPRPAMPAEPVVTIPLKYYGFVKPVDQRSPNRGFFMDGDDVLVASEGELIKGQYLVVELTPNSAKMEDVRLKRGQTLPVVPEAVMPQ